MAARAQVTKDDMIQALTTIVVEGWGSTVESALTEEAD